MANAKPLNNTKPLENIKTWQRLVSSSFGALVTSSVVTPLDVIKIRIQVQNKPLSRGDCFIYCNGLMDHIYQCKNGNNKSSFESRLLCRAPVKFNSTYDACQKIIKTEGFRSLWSGLSPTLLMAVPQVVIYYTLNDYLKGKLGYSSYQKVSATKSHIFNGSKNNSGITTQDLIPPVSAAISRLVAQTTIAPLELLRTKMQSKKISFSEMRGILRNSIKETGVAVLWRGMGPTMWRDMPYTVILWFVYEFQKKRFIEQHNSDTIPLHSTFLFSGIGGFIAGVVSHPFDLTKTHRQVELGQSVLQNKTISSTWSYLRQLYKSHGITSLFSGFGPRITRVCLATSIMISIFEYTKAKFIQHNNNLESSNPSSHHGHHSNISSVDITNQQLVNTNTN